jgi:hypothetical protein
MQQPCNKAVATFIFFNINKFIMKNLFTLLVAFALGSLYANAQCDIAQRDFTITPSTISIGQSAELKFSVYNAGANSNCEYSEGAIEVVLSLPSTGYKFDSFVSPLLGKGEYFTWVYDDLEKVIIGVNHKAIPRNVGDFDVTVKVIGNAEKKATSVLNIGVVDGSPNMSIDNDPAFYALEVTAAPLPVRLISFSAQSTDLGNELNWKTASETDFSHFEIEKSVDATTFKQIGKVNGNNQAKESFEYQYLDRKITTGVVPGAYPTASSYNGSAYYRLKMVDLNGKFDYSKIVFVEDKSNNSNVSNFYPNPALGQMISIEIFSNESTEWNISTMNLSGRLINTENKMLNKGLNILTFAPSENTGVLIYRFANANTVQYRKLIP